jgi:hypothetical protein
MKPMIASALCSIVLLCACGDKPQPIAEPQPEVEPMPIVVEEAPDQPVAEAEPTEAELPVSDDFADEVESSIDESNYSAALDELERELAERH